MIELGVNIDHVATLRQQRFTSYPNPVEAARRAEDAGADVITLHLREDRRHIQDADVPAIKAVLRTRMNLECAVTPEMLTIACRIRPEDVCLVPEKRSELTTEGGLDVLSNFSSVQQAVAQLHDAKIRVSLFIDADAAQIDAAARAGATVIELHTGAYSDAADSAAIDQELIRLRAGVAAGVSQGLRVNAGHGLHYDNGHAIVARAVFDGWEKAVRDMKALLRKG